ncbi:MAG: hypothetical protein AB1641_20070 [Thermodesulfobacteriota bacterium]
MIEEAIKKLILLLRGRVPEPIDTERITDEKEHELAVLLNRLFSFVHEIHGFILPLSKGKLEEAAFPPPKNFLASPFKELHSHLQHLTWQAKQIAKGDYSQRVDFMGDFSDAFNFMITSLDNNEKALKTKIGQLEEALSHIAKLEGILPICANCKRIRIEGADPKDQNSWIAIESYIGDRTNARFSHSICPKCMKQLYLNLIP